MPSNSNKLIWHRTVTGQWLWLAFAASGWLISVHTLFGLFKWDAIEPIFATHLTHHGNTSRGNRCCARICLAHSNAANWALILLMRCRLRWVKIDWDPSLSPVYIAISTHSDSHNARSITVIIANHAHNGTTSIGCELCVLRALALGASRSPPFNLLLRTNYGQVSRTNTHTHTPLVARGTFVIWCWCSCCLLGWHRIKNRFKQVRA